MIWARHLGRVEPWLRTLRAAASRENIASHRVLTKTGFVQAGPADLGGKPGTWYQRDLGIQP